MLARRALVGIGQAATRSGSGRGWYQKVLKEKNVPTYQVSSNIPDTDHPRPKCYFDILMDGDDAPERMIFELVDDVVPKTVDNFKKLLTNGEESGLSLRNSEIHHVSRIGVTGGVTASGNHSAMGSQYMDEENFVIRHAEAGILSMVSAGTDQVGSVFFVTSEPSLHLDGKQVAFGRLLEGKDVLGKVQGAFAIGGKPLNPIKISDCGLL